MAPKTIRMAILAALEDLGDEDLEKFCSQLLDRKGKRPARSFVMGKRRVHITNILIQTYTDQDAPGVVLETLKDAGFDDTAKAFEKATSTFTTSKRKEKRKSKARGASGAAAGGRVVESDAADEMDSPEDPAVSFIRDKKTKLITCLGANRRILQFAQENNVITDEEYRKMKSIPSTDDTATELIDVVMGQGPVLCRRFLQILKKPNVVKTYSQLEEIMQDWE